MSAVITSIVCTLILNIVSIYVMTTLLHKKYNIFSIKNNIIIIILTLIQTLTYNQSYSIIYIITNYLLLVVVNKVIFQENMYKTIIATCILVITIMLADFFNSIFIINFISLEKIRSYWYLRVLSNVVVSTLIVIIMSIPIIRKKCIYFINKFGNKYISITSLFIILVICIVFITHNISINFQLNIEFIANTLTVIALIIFCYIFINENNEFNILNEKYDSLFNYVQTFENWIEKEQLNRHEYKNQLASIRCRTKEKKVKDKIDSIMLDNINITNDTVNQLKPIPNGGLKGLLYYKIAIAENNKLNIELDISIKNPDIIKKLSEDKIKILCRLLGIYLDNAIEAAKETKKKIISIEIYEVDKNINIVITNTFDNTNDISKRNDKGFTTKGKGHGKGLYFAKKMLDKSNWLEESQSILDKYYIQRLIIKK